MAYAKTTYKSERFQLPCADGAREWLESMMARVEELESKNCTNIKMTIDDDHEWDRYGDMGCDYNINATLSWTRPKTAEELAAEKLEAKRNREANAAAKKAKLEQEAKDLERKLKAAKELLSKHESLAGRLGLVK